MLNINSAHASLKLVCCPASNRFTHSCCISGFAQPLKTAEKLKHWWRLWVTELYCCLSHHVCIPTFPSFLFLQSESVWDIPLCKAEALAKARFKRNVCTHAYTHTHYFLLKRWHNFKKCHYSSDKGCGFVVVLTVGNFIIHIMAIFCSVSTIGY